jgi:hypothetical protein
MKRSLVTKIGGAVALVAALASSPALLAQRGRACGMCDGGGPRYDAAKEVVLSGTVDAVTEMQGRRGMSGVHLTLNAGGAPVEVHLGPSSFLKEKGLAVAKGDSLEVRGARVDLGGVDSLLAREVTRAGAVTVLRDEDGVPLWSRGRGMRRGR